MRVNLLLSSLKIGNLSLLKRRTQLLYPAHRLLPEVNGSAVLQDIEDFWTWTSSSFKDAIATECPALTVDLDRIAVSGENSGGYLSLQSALLLPKVKIRAVIAQYPSTYPNLEVHNQRLESATGEEDRLLTDYSTNFKVQIRLESKVPWMQDVLFTVINMG